MLQNIFLRTNSLNEKTMTLSLLGSSLPFHLYKTFTLNRKFGTDYGNVKEDITTVVPATYSRPTTQQDEQSFLIITGTQLVRITE